MPPTKSIASASAYKLPANNGESTRELEASADGAPQKASKLTARPYNLSVRFEQYKIDYKRSYGSKIEELLRLKVFLGKCLRIFASQVAYKFGLKGYWLDVNGKTDRLLSELKATELRAPSDLTHESATPSQQQQQQPQQEQQQQQQQQPQQPQQQLEPNQELRLIDGEDGAKLLQLVNGDPEADQSRLGTPRLLFSQDEAQRVHVVEGELERLRRRAEGPIYEQLVNEMETLEGLAEGDNFGRQQVEQNSRDVVENMNGNRHKRSTDRALGLAGEQFDTKGAQRFIREHYLFRAPRMRKFSLTDHLIGGRKTISKYQLARETVKKISLGHRQPPPSSNADYMPPEQVSRGRGRAAPLGRDSVAEPRAEEDYVKLYYHSVDLSQEKLSKPFRRLPVRGNYKVVGQREKSDKMREIQDAEQRFLKQQQPGWAQLFQLTGALLSGLGDLFGADEEVAAAEPREQPDVVWLDHRDSNCLWPPEDQANCSSCYLITVNSYLEWAHCKQTGKLVKFSAQYPLDCGSRYFEDLRGCETGNILSAISFYRNFGLELEQSYPYVARAQQCPYDGSVKASSMGYLRIKSNQIATIPLEYFEHYLQFGPIIMNIGTRGDFYDYAGGVHDGKSCGREGTHSVLLIGHGRQDGEEYWLIRNSHSVEFGELGHYKLNKNSDCIHPKVGFMFGTRDAQTISLFVEQNSNHREPTTSS